MKSWIFLFTLLLFACSSPEKKSTPSSETETVSKGPISDSEDPIKKETLKYDLSWLGTINEKIPVFVHFQTDEEVVVGEIVYLNTKNKTPIKLLGKIEESNNYFLREYDDAGNITGSISGTLAEDSFSGIWFAPGKDKDWKIQLMPKDTLIPSMEIAANLEDVFGSYHYQFGDEGYQGDITMTQKEDGSQVFSLFSMTQAPARNMAEIETNVNVTDPEFLYQISEEGDEQACACKVKFYKDFVFVTYTQTDCFGYFGHRATVEGIFLKL